MKLSEANPNAPMTTSAGRDTFITPTTLCAAEFRVFTHRARNSVATSAIFFAQAVLTVMCPRLTTARTFTRNRAFSRRQTDEEPGR